MFGLPRASLPLALLASLALACSSNSTSPSGTTSATALQSVTFGGPTTSNPDGTITMRFNGAMMAGMEHYVDLHQGDITGPQVPMTCTWSTDRSTMTCTPNAPLTPGEAYTLHMGAGMQGSNGMPVNMAAGTGMGGTWMTMGMGGRHNGSMMGGDWTDTAGHDGMLFPFTAS